MIAREDMRRTCDTLVTRLAVGRGSTASLGFSCTSGHMMDRGHFRVVERKMGTACIFMLEYFIFLLSTEANHHPSKPRLK